MGVLIRSLGRRPGRWLVGMALVLVASSWLSTRLELRADLLSMLPQDVPAAQAYAEFLDRFDGLERVFIVVATDQSALDNSVSADDLDQRIVDVALNLEQRLAGEPLVAGLRAGINPEDERFLLEYVVPRTVLRDSSWTKDRIAAKLEFTALVERANLLREMVRNPVGEMDARLARTDPLGFSRDALLDQSGDLGVRVDPFTGLFRGASDGGPASALLTIEPKASELDASAGLALALRLEELFDEVLREHGDGLQILATGGPLYAAADERLIRTDLENTISLSVAGCLLVLLFAFGSWRAVLVATSVLVFAFALSFGVLTVTLQEMLAVSLGFAAVLIGLGIDYVIHAITRYRQGLDEGCPPDQALIRVYAESGWAIFASALTTACAFAVLLLSAIRPLVEIGFLVSVGILGMLAGTVLVGGPMMVLLIRKSSVENSTAATEPPRWWQRLDVLWGLAGSVPTRLIGFAQRRPWPVLLTFVAVVVVATLLAVRLEFSPRFEDLRTEDHPLEAAERALSEEFGLDEDTVTILVRGENLDAALVRSERIVGAVEQGAGALGQLEGSISSPSQVLMPRRQLENRLQELSSLEWERAADTLEELFPTVGLSPEAFRPGLSVLRDFGAGQEPSLGRDLEMPDWVRSQIATDKYQKGQTEQSDESVLLALRVRTDAAGSAWLASGEARHALAEAAGVTADGEEDRVVSVASAVALGEQMRTVGEREVGWLAVSSLAVVLLLVSLAMGLAPLATIIALVPILTGAVVAFGTLALWSGRLDFLSLAVVPMLFGIGIDDGLHALCGRGIFVGRNQPLNSVLGGGWWRGRGSGKRRIVELPRRVEHASRAITLTTITTVVGFGSLTASSMPGLRNGGVVVAVGVVACWVATVMVLPALATVLYPSSRNSGPELPASGSALVDQPVKPTGVRASAGDLGGAAASQAPEVSQRWMQRLGFLHFSSPFWYRLHAWTLRTLPSWAIALIMWPLLFVFYLALGNVRTALVTNRRAVAGASRFGVFGDHGRALATLYQYAWCFNETYEGLFDPSTRRVATVTGEENWQAVTGEMTDHDGKMSAADDMLGFVICTAHVGHWEVGSHLSKFERPRTVHVVREPEMNPASQAFLEELFGEGDDCYQVHFARAEDAMLGGRLLSALRRGEIVALQGDRPRAGGKTLKVALFGRPYELPVGPFAMARAARVPILPVFVFRQGRRRSDLHLRSPIDVPRTADRSGDFQVAADQFIAQVEWAIRAHPEQWFCLRQLWPDGAGDTPLPQPSERSPES